jgi:hypothetical protein
MRVAQVKRRRVAGGRCTSWDRRLRRLGCVLGAGILLQTTSGGCEAQLSQTIQTLAQDVGSGIGKGATSLGEAFVLNLFI